MEDMGASNRQKHFLPQELKLKMIVFRYYKDFLTLCSVAKKTGGNGKKILNLLLSFEQKSCPNKSCKLQTPYTRKPQIRLSKWYNSDLKSIPGIDHIIPLQSSMFGLDHYIVRANNPS
jgi:hypothetical protein